VELTSMTVIQCEERIFLFVIELKHSCVFILHLYIGAIHELQRVDGRILAGAYRFANLAFLTQQMHISR
jgi:hypothetical protein